LPIRNILRYGRDAAGNRIREARWFISLAYRELDLVLKDLHSFQNLLPPARPAAQGMSGGMG